MDRCFLSLLLRRMGFAGNGLGVGKLPGAAASLPRACLRRCSDGYGPDGPLLSDVETSPVPSALLLLPSTQVTPNFLFPHHFYAFWSHWKELAFGSTCQFSPLARKILPLNARVHAPKYCLSLPVLSLGPWCLFCAFSPALPCHPLKLQWNPFFLGNEYTNTGLSSFAPSFVYEFTKLKLITPVSGSLNTVLGI